MKFRSIHLSVLCLLGLLLTAAVYGEDGRIRILGIGNSFTENSTRYLPSIIRSNPEIAADVAVAGIGGSPLDLHVSLAQAHEANPEAGKKYKYLYNLKLLGEAEALKDILTDQPWDYVTIQQVSHKSYKPETYTPYARELVDYIRRYAPDAKIILHETWSHSIDSYRYKDWGLAPDEMYARLHAAYANIADELGLEVIPVGTAFENAKATPMWDYQPTTVDVDQLSYPEDRDNLPDMSRSLHKVFYWHPDKDQPTGWRLVSDGFHANTKGWKRGQSTFS